MRVSAWIYLPPHVTCSASECSHVTWNHQLNKPKASRLLNIKNLVESKFIFYVLSEIYCDNNIHIMMKLWTTGHTVGRSNHSVVRECSNLWERACAHQASPWGKVRSSDALVYTVIRSIQACNLSRIAGLAHKWTVADAVIKCEGDTVHEEFFLLPIVSKVKLILDSQGCTASSEECQGECRTKRVAFLLTKAS